MNSSVADLDEPPASDSGRRAAVLESALTTFARFGYRKTSMDEVARTARISRPGLYFLFASKEALFRAAVSQALDSDLAAAERILNDTARPLSDRLLDAFQQWAGRYIGPTQRDIPRVIDENPGLLGSVVATAPQRFADLIESALATSERTDGSSETEVTQTLISTSIGIKHQAATAEQYRERLELAIRLLVR